MSSPVLARILGIDYGEKRVGIAISDALGIAAHPWGMLARDEKLFTSLSELVVSEHITTVVIGMPLTLKGEKGPKAQEVEGFIRELREMSEDLEIIEWDERFTTSMAQKTLRLLEQKRSKRSNKSGRVDAMAAALLLQSFLDSTKHSRVC